LCWKPGLLARQIITFQCPSQTPNQTWGSATVTRWWLQVGKCEMPTIEEHGGYYCAGCKQSWFSLCSLIHHRASPAMRGTDCERKESSRELRNVYRSNLASGLELRLPIIPAGTSILLCIFCCMMWIAPHDNLKLLHVFFKPPTALIESTRGPEAPLRKYSEVIGGNRRIWSNSG
jgi:hypothetical protein